MVGKKSIYQGYWSPEHDYVAENSFSAWFQLQMSWNSWKARAMFPPKSGNGDRLGSLKVATVTDWAPWKQQCWQNEYAYRTVIGLELQLEMGESLHDLIFLISFRYLVSCLLQVTVPLDPIVMEKKLPLKQLAGAVSKLIMTPTG